MATSSSTAFDGTDENLAEHAVLPKHDRRVCDRRV
jgi:hypothetical protein